MNILFVLKRSGIAGVETLLIRMVNHFVNHYGVKVSLLLMVRGNCEEFFEKLHPECKIYVSTQFSDLLALRKNNYDVAYAFESIGLMWFISLKTILGFKVKKEVIGCYHPMEYFWEKPMKSYLQRQIAQVVTKLPPQNMLFMNEGVRIRYNEMSGLNSDKSIVLPIPIDLHRFEDIERNPVQGKFVSIGRLVDFKTYNAHAIETIYRLKQEGFCVTYHIYGDGELYDELNEMISKYDLSGEVFLEGSLPYGKIDEVFSTAYCFIGCGTALLEASAAGVPSVVGVEAIQDSLSTGFFCDQTGYNVGEFVRSDHFLGYYDLMKQVLQLSPDNYKKMSDKHKIRVASFDIDTFTKNYMSFLSQSEETNLKGFYLLWFVVFVFQKILSIFGIKNSLHTKYFFDKNK